MTIQVIGVNGLSDLQAALYFDSAKTYLSQSNLAAFLISQLEAIPEVLTIKVEVSPNNSCNDNWASSQGTAGTITWNIASRLQVTENPVSRPTAYPFSHMLSTLRPQRRDELSPALILMHEMGHACQAMSGANQDEMLNENRNQDGTLNILAIENINVQAIENTVAMELSEAGCREGIRWDYLDAKALQSR
ncbi:M91 family zinc metallopeptidase [Pseudoalteromonas phenolica]|uniref:M91 family zinc metallopeptidase n=1 Tax=Pseudoalteromonas phenolica TaxID=161398 RepID=UPI00110B336C|nr:M91 family zinc metallopeptidase [Pseudoalteromonas phenolica]TMO57958.1 hypothetical protein CWC21_01515 [Pseudoalteromonas phenolica]